MDDFELFDRYQKPAAGDETTRLLGLGRIYLNGSVLDEDEKAAFTCFEKAAAGGDPEAEYQLGLCYFLGVGTEMDRAKGYNLLLKASDKGYHIATAFLGTIYMNGEGVKANPEKGFELLTRAAEMGCTEAMEHLSFMYQLGLGVEKDPDMCIALLERAVAEGGPMAKYSLGSLMLKGFCREKDEENGIGLMREASDAGIGMASLECIYYCEEHGLAEEARQRARMLAEQCEDPEMLYNGATSLLRTLGKKEAFVDEAILLLTAASDKGNGRPDLLLGHLYDDSNKAEHDNAKAFEHFMKAAEKNQPEAFGMVGRGFELGLGVPMDLYSAESWYTRGDSEGDSYSQLRLALLQSTGRIGHTKPQDVMKLLKKAHSNGSKDAVNYLANWYEKWEPVKSIPEAIYWYRVGAKEGIVECMNSLAEHMLSGAYIKEDPMEAFRLYERISNQNHHTCWGYAGLGRMYEEGLGVERNIRKAKEYYRMGAKKINPFSMYRLSELTVQEDEKLFWLIAAASNRLTTAMWELGSRFERGDGVWKSHDLAIEWYHSASEKGMKDAADNMAQLLLNMEPDEPPSEYQKTLFEAGDGDLRKLFTLAKMRETGSGGVRANKRIAKMWRDIAKLFDVKEPDPELLELMEEMRSESEREVE